MSKPRLKVEILGEDYWELQVKDQQAVAGGQLGERAPDSPAPQEKGRGGTRLKPGGESAHPPFLKLYTYPSARCTNFRYFGCTSNPFSLKLGRWRMAMRPTCRPAYFPPGTLASTISPLWNPMNCFSFGA